MPDTLDALQAAVDELLLIVPKLDAALAKDQGSGDEPVNRTPTAPSAPVNTEVMAAIDELQRDVSATESWARAILAKPAASRSIADGIRGMPSLYQRLEATNAQEEAERLASRVHRWHRVVRQAIGLIRPAQRVIRDDAPVNCPLHDEPHTALLQPGLEGTLHPHGAKERITWKRQECVYCPSCGARWEPSEYGLLGRLTADAERRRAA